MLRLRIDEQAFRDLVAGRVARVSTPAFSPYAGGVGHIDCELILADIGWDHIIKAIHDARDE